MRGLERGIERAIGTINTIAYVEIEAFIAWNLAKTMEQGLLDPSPIWTDLKTFPWKEFHGKVHGIIGGYPCQPFSVAGKQGGAADPRHLWPYIKIGISAINPDWCFFENVPGHINLGFREVKSDLESMGYRVKAGIYSAEEIGAPHQRKRLFILGIKMEHSEHIRWNGAKNRESVIKGDDGNETWKENVIQPSGSGGSKLANSSQSRLQGYTRHEQGQGREGVGPNRSTTKSSISLWPARPKNKQYEWEAPRTESRLGFTINGYNFREDLLRMAGNGVVEQTAELAFRNLLIKHSIY